MVGKLGELLVKAGKITTAQLEETLKAQAIFGGRLGTNLVEMGYLDERELTDFLSKKSGVPAAPPDQMMNISPQVKKLVPEETVKKHRVVPVALQNRKLFLAMTDPSDFATIDEISFLTGYIVTPLISPELRVITALEKHYNVKRDVRYITLGGGAGRGSRRAAAEAAAPVAPARPTPAAPSAAAAPPQSAFLADDDDIIELPLLGEVEYLSEDVQVAAHLSAAPTQAPAKAEALTLEQVLLGLSEARDRHDIADLLVGYAAQTLERAAVFLVRGEMAMGWQARRRSAEIPDFDALEISLAEVSVLKTVVESKSVHLGPLPIAPCNGAIIAALGGSSQHSLLIPLTLAGRVVAVFYADGNPVQLAEQAASLQKLVGKGALAFEILILKGKILNT